MIYIIQSSFICLLCWHLSLMTWFYIFLKFESFFRHFFKSFCFNDFCIILLSFCLIFSKVKALEAFLNAFLISFEIRNLVRLFLKFESFLNYSRNSRSIYTFKSFFVSIKIQKLLLLTYLKDIACKQTNFLVNLRDYSPFHYPTHKIPLSSFHWILLKNTKTSYLYY